MCDGTNDCAKCMAHNDCSTCLNESNVDCYWKDGGCLSINQVNSLNDPGQCAALDCGQYGNVCECVGEPGCSFRDGECTGATGKFEDLGFGVCANNSDFGNPPNHTGGSPPNYSKNYSSKTVCENDCLAWSGPNWDGPKCMGYSFNETANNRCALWFDIDQSIMVNTPANATERAKLWPNDNELPTSSAKGYKPHQGHTNWTNGDKIKAASGHTNWICMKTLAPADPADNC